MAKYIERGAIIDQLLSMADASAKLHDGIMTAVFQIKNQPIADVQTVRRGQWKVCHDITGIYYYCSACTCGRVETPEKYCHDCGAEMTSVE